MQKGARIQNGGSSAVQDGAGQGRWLDPAAVEGDLGSGEDAVAVIRIEEERARRRSAGSTEERGGASERGAAKSARGGGAKSTRGWRVVFAAVLNRVMVRSCARMDGRDYSE